MDRTSDPELASWVESADGHPELPFADTARALLERVLNDSATAVMLIWELPDDSCRWQAVPDHPEQHL